MRHGIGQSIRGKLVVDRTFAAPARVTASQIRFTVAVGIEQFGDLRIFQLRDVGDFVLVGSFLIDQVTLCRAVNKYSFTIKFLIATGSFVHVVMQWRPVHCGEGCIAGSKRGVANVVIHFAGFIDGIT